MDRDELAQAIIDLENGRVNPLVDEQLAYDLGHHLKHLIDRIDHRADEGAPNAPHLSIGTGELTEDRSEPNKRATLTPLRFDGPTPELATLSNRDRARWIFMERYIPLEQLEEILGCTFSPEEFEHYYKALDDFLDRLFLLTDVASALETCDLPALQKIFASTLILLRHKQIGNGINDRLPCTLENLRLRFGDYFYKRRSVPNWYEVQPFFTTPLREAQWVLCGLEYLNCSLRSPEKKLSNYARNWSLPRSSSKQKNVVEDVYDRIVIGEALREDLFEQNCHSCTTTSYQKEAGITCQVYTVQKDQKIAIHGKVGLPHWRMTRRLWPGVYPTLVP